MDKLVFSRVFRCIARHTRYIGDPILGTDLGLLKSKLRTAKKTKDSRVLRSRIKALYSVEQSLRDIEQKKLSVPQFRKVWALDTVRTGRSSGSVDSALGERNQGGRRQLWLQQEARRFDQYNAPPRKGSEEYRRVDYLAKFMDNATRFSHKFKCSPNDLVVSTVLAPFWKLSTRREPACRPRPVEVRSIKRNSGTLSLLRVRGVQMRSKGLRRHIEDIDKDRHSRLLQLDFDIWLARQYALDPLDGEDMDSWIELLVAERRRLKHDLFQLGLKLEVQRRILLRRRAELERDWEWRHRKRMREIERQALIKPKPLLTLATL